MPETDMAAAGGKRGRAQPEEWNGSERRNIAEWKSCSGIFIIMITYYIVDS